MAVGKTFDESEIARISSLLNEQQKQLDLVDKENDSTNKSILRYTILLAGGVLVLVVLKVLINKKK